MNSRKLSALLELTDVIRMRDLGQYTAQEFKRRLNAIEGKPKNLNESLKLVAKWATELSKTAPDVIVAM